MTLKSAPEPHWPSNQTPFANFCEYNRPTFMFHRVVCHCSRWCVLGKVMAWGTDYAICIKALWAFGSTVTSVAFFFVPTK